MADYFFNENSPSGGAGSTSSPWGSGEWDEVISNVSNGDRVFWTNGTGDSVSGPSTPSGTQTFTQNENADISRFQLIGYRSNTGDGGTFSCSARIAIAGEGTDMLNFHNVDSQGSVPLVNVNSSAYNCNFFNCYFKNDHTNVNSYAFRTQDSTNVINCYLESKATVFSNCQGVIYCTSFDAVNILGCVIRGKNGVGLNNMTESSMVADCLIYGSTGCSLDTGIECDMYSGSSEVVDISIINNTIANFTKCGVYLHDLPPNTDRSRYRNLCVNNLIYGHPGACAGISSADDAWWHMYNNAFGNVTNNTVGLTGTNPEFTHISLSADPFVNSDIGDFRLNIDANGGSECRSKGVAAYGSGATLSGSMQNGDQPFVNRKDIGAIQHSGLVERVTVG